MSRYRSCKTSPPGVRIKDRFVSWDSSRSKRGTDASSELLEAVEALLSLGGEVFIVVPLQPNRHVAAATRRSVRRFRPARVAHAR
jgi:hypothetical protein